MAKAKAPAEARALIDLPQYGAKCGDLVSADPDVIKQLVDVGAVDAHPDAVANAKSRRD